MNGDMHNGEIQHRGFYIKTDAEILESIVICL